MKKTILSLFLLILSVGVLAACGTSSSDQKSSANEEKVTLRIAQTGWGSYEQGLKAAGLDKDLPYNVEYSVFQGGNLILEAMNAGHVDFGSTSEIPPIFSSLSENGDKTKQIAISKSNTLLQEIIVPKDSDIQSVADLKGKTVAYVQNTTAQYFLAKILAENGLSWDDIEAKSLTTADGLTALLGNNVDALASYGNTIISAKEKGATTLASAQDVLSGNFPISVPESVLKDDKKKEAIIDYLERLNKSYVWQREHLDEWAKIYAQNTKQPVETAKQILKDGEKQQPTVITPVSDEAIASQQDIANVFKELKLLDHTVDVKNIWSTELNDAVSKIEQ